MPQIQMIYGPPGTGKTNKLMELLEQELETTPKNRIAYVSFTNKGVDVGVERARAKFGGEQEDYPYFRTLHSLAFKELGLKYGNVMAKRHYKDLSKQLQMNFLGYMSVDLVHNDDMYLAYEDLRRNSRRQADRFLRENENAFDTVTSDFVHRNYERYKEKYGLVDFTDMVEQFVERAEPVPVDVAFIDEAQDLTDLQWKMVKVAFFDCRKLYVAGDDDQAIFTWAGASVNTFLTLQDKSAEKLPPIFLRHSYRLPASVLRLADSVIKQNKVRVDKPFDARGEEGKVERVNSFEEVEINDKDTYLFLARNRKFLLPIEEWLKDKGEHYISCDAEPVSRREMKRAKEWEEYRKTATELPGENTALGQLLREGVSLSDPFWDAFALDLDQLSYMRKLYQAGTDITAEPRIRVSTIHRVKGGEADHVILLLDLARRTYVHYLEYPEDEVRCFYVGMTRARESLSLVASSSPYAFSLDGMPATLNEIRTEKRRAARALVEKE